LSAKRTETKEGKGSTMMLVMYVAAAVGKKARLGMKQRQAVKKSSP